MEGEPSAATTRAASPPPTSTRPRVAWPPSSTRRRLTSWSSTTSTAATATPTTSRSTGWAWRPPTAPAHRCVYMSTMDRDFMRGAAVAGPPSRSSPPRTRSTDADTLGEPAARITTRGRCRPWVCTKRAAMRAHASQISEDSFFLSMPDESSPRSGARSGSSGSGPSRRAWATASARAGWSSTRPALALGGGVCGKGRRMTRHKVLRVHGGRLVVAERRVELESELDALAAEGLPSSTRSPSMTTSTWC